MLLRDVEQHHSNVTAAINKPAEINSDRMNALLQELDFVDSEVRRLFLPFHPPDHLPPSSVLSSTFLSTSSTFTFPFPASLPPPFLPPPPLPLSLSPPPFPFIPSGSLPPLLSPHVSFHIPPSLSLSLHLSLHPSLHPSSFPSLTSSSMSIPTVINILSLHDCNYMYIVSAFSCTSKHITYETA